jgi:3-carboxy-cis,cis-muconate cycloisomerase
MSVRLIEALATTGPLAEVFSDESTLAALLKFEAALARAEARCGIIPPSAADAIERAAQSRDFDVGELARDALRAGTPVIPLVKALTERVRECDAESARFVHFGATSQDVADTALVLLLKRARPLVAADQERLERALRGLSEAHRDTVMLGRTLLQPAPPVTFGLKVAGWLAAARRGWARVDATFTAALVVQFGGASGTLAALGERGLAVGHALAEELGLELPEAPWHAHRDRLAALVAACGIYTGSLGKMARDVALLMQGEVGEVSEPLGPERGGSSTMPHKRNPIASAITLAAAHRVPGLVAGFLAGMVQEHERGVGGWLAEWPTLAAVIEATGVAAASMAEAAEGLAVDERRMRANIEATCGVIFAEKVMMILGPSLGRDVASELLARATQRCLAEGRSLADMLREMPEVARGIPEDQLHALDSPRAYLGVAESLRARLLAPPAPGATD